MKIQGQVSGVRKLASLTRQCAITASSLAVPDGHGHQEARQARLWRSSARGEAKNRGNKALTADPAQGSPAILGTKWVPFSVTSRMMEKMSEITLLRADDSAASHSLSSSYSCSGRLEEARYNAVLLSPPNDA